MRRVPGILQRRIVDPDSKGRFNGPSFSNVMAVMYRAIRYGNDLKKKFKDTGGVPTATVGKMPQL